MSSLGHRTFQLTVSGLMFKLGWKHRTKEGARSELYHTAQIAVTCSQITVQTTSVF